MKTETRPRAAIVVGEFPLASETFILSQVAGLLDEGVDVLVLCEKLGTSGLGHSQVASHDLMNKVRVCHDHMIYRWAERLGSYRVKQIAGHIATLLGYTSLRQEFDVILCHFGPTGERMAKLKGMNLVGGELWTAFHGYDLSKTLREERRPYEALKKHGTKFLPVSKLWKERLIALGMPSEDIVIHGMGVDLERIPYVTRETSNGRPVRILSTCRLVEKKGLAYGLRALAKLNDADPDLAWAYTILGDGALRGELEALTRDLGIAHRVSFLGAQTGQAVFDTLLKADIFLLPSVTAEDGDMETQPVAIKEAMASGAAIASTRHGGIPDFVEHGVSGLLADERDVEGLAQALETLVRDETTRRAMTIAARTEIEERFDNRALNARLADLIRVAAAARARPSMHGAAATQEAPAK